MRYRRSYIPGGSYFFTQVTHARRPLFDEPHHVDTLREAFRAIRTARPFSVDAVVVLPDHLHCIGTLPPGDSDYSIRWRLIKTWFTKRASGSVRCQTDAAQARRGEQAIWQRRFWEHCLRDQADFDRHVDYIHFNPVRHGYVRQARDWRYSSFHRYVREGLLLDDWACGPEELSGVGDE
jgi:putative transposase